jgi:arginyl-tRNA synthetase
MSTQVEQLEAALKAAISRALDSGSLTGAAPDAIKLERPKDRSHGDYASSIALQLAKPAGMNPREVAQIIADQLHGVDGISKVDIAGPGFINITLNRASQAALVETILKATKDYGKGNALAGVKINLEFISANPTGPLHLGHTRWAAVGDALGRVLTAAGAQVTREFYINDRGNQMDYFGQSVEAVALGNPVPENGYQGEYIKDLATDVVAQNAGIKELPEAERVIAFREAAYQLQLKDQQRVLDTFNTHFDVWFSERSLHDQGAVEHGMEKLRKQGHVFEDRVMTKSDGSLTYFSSDTAYYINKRERGFDICIYMLGADHHGYIGRLKATAACAGDDPEYNIHVLIGQLVKIMEGGEEVKLSKRAGTIITLEELVEKVGVDAARYTLIRYPVDTPMVMDLDVLKRNTNENPVYYVQYAHARIAAVLRNAQELGASLELKDFDPSQLSHDRENELLGALAEFPRVVASAAEFREPHRIARYLEELAGTYHGFYNDCRVLPMGEEKLSALHTARLLLCTATKQVISNGLDLLGVNAPERM